MARGSHPLSTLPERTEGGLILTSPKKLRPHEQRQSFKAGG